MTDPRDKLCLALDVASLDEASVVVKELTPYVGLFKVGMQLFTAEGPRVVKVLNELGGKVFLDLKYHDIPNTVALAAKEAVRLGVAFFDVHASGGLEMMQAVATSVRSEASHSGISAPKVLAITVLTSLATRELGTELNVSVSAEDQVRHLARLAMSANMDGVVASPRESQLIRQECGAHFTIVTPGIRPAWAAEQGDQKRITTPSEAIRSGSDVIVVGRPILAAKDRVAACKKVLSEISEALAA